MDHLHYLYQAPTNKNSRHLIYEKKRISFLNFYPISMRKYQYKTKSGHFIASIIDLSHVYHTKRNNLFRGDKSFPRLKYTLIKCIGHDWNLNRPIYFTLSNEYIKNVLKLTFFVLVVIIIYISDEL